MTTLDTVVVGAGHAGLAVSRLLTDAGRDHVVLDRGRIGERWRSERWDSLHLLTPSWMTRLPGWSYTGPDPDGYLSAGQFVGLLDAYAASFGAPVVEERDGALDRADRRRHPPLPGRHDPGHLARPPRRHRDGPARGAVRPVRTRRCSRASRWSPRTTTATPSSSAAAACSSWVPRPPGCRSPTSSTGPAATSPSPSARTPGCPGATAAWTSSGGSRRRAGWPGPSTRCADPEDARRDNSLQLVGRNDPPRAAQDLDLGVLHARGVRLVGRLESVTGHRARFRGDLAASTRERRRCDATDSSTASTASSTRSGWRTRCGAVAGPGRSRCLQAPERLDLRAAGIDTVLVAAGYRHDHPWLRLPITDSGRQLPSAPRRHARTGRVRRRAAVPAPAGLGLHRRRAPRRACRRAPPPR